MIVEPITIIEILTKDWYTWEGIVLIVVIKLFLDWRRFRENSEKVQTAEKEAFEIRKEATQE